MNIRNIIIYALAALSCFPSYGMNQPAQGQKRPLDTANTTLSLFPPQKRPCLEQNGKSPLYIQLEKTIFSFNRVALENLLIAPETARLNKTERTELHAHAQQLKKQVKEMRAIGSTIAGQTDNPKVKAKFSFDDECKNIEKITHYLYALKTLPKFIFPQAFFTHAPYSNTPQTKPTPDEALLALIKNEQKRICICCFHFNLLKIAHALVHQKNKGIDVELFTNQSQGRGPDCNQAIKLLMENKIPVSSPQNDTFEDNHHKFALFSCNLLDKKLLCTGSFNWTDHATKRSWDDLNILDNEDIIEQYEERIDQLRERSSTYVMPTASTFQPQKVSPPQQMRPFSK